jgi:hypothetical protein
LGSGGFRGSKERGGVVVGKKTSMAFVDDATEEREGFNRIVDYMTTRSAQSPIVCVWKRTFILLTSFSEELLEVEPIFVREIRGRG